MAKANLPRNYWIGLIIMILAYTIVQLSFNTHIIPVPGWLLKHRQFFRWLNILFVYGIGILVIQKMSPGWLLFSWNLVHVVLMGYLAVAAAYEYFIAPMPYGVRGSAAPIIEFLISPVFYVIMGLVYHTLHTNEKKKL